MLKKLAVIVVGIIVTLCTSAFAADLNFSADVETKTPDRVMTSKYYVKGTKMRMEMAGRGGEGAISITRPDKKVVWMVMPPQKMYMEMPIKENMQTRLNDPNVKVERTLVGSETVEGHPTKKYHITSVVDGEKQSGYAWQATDLNNWVIKFQPEDKQMTITWKNIKQGGGNDDSLYEVPKGYKKMDMPAMPGIGGGGRPGR